MSSSNPTAPSARRFVAPALLVLAGLVVRAIGVDADLPAHRLAFDEDYVVSDAFHFAAERTIVPNSYFYPPFYSYLVTVGLGGWYAGGRLTGTFDGPDDFGWEHYLHPGRFHLVGRLLTLAFAGATLLVLVRLGTEYRAGAIGLVAAILVAGERTHVERSHYALPDVPMTFFVAWGCLELLRVARRGDWRDYVRAGLAIGLAAATKYNAGVLAIGLPVAHLERFGGRPLAAIRSGRPWLAASVAAAAFLAAAPIWLVVPERAAEGLAFERANVQEGGHLGHVPDEPWAWIGRSVLSLEPFLGAFFLAGLVAAPFRRVRGTWTLAAICAVTFLYVGGWVKQSLHYLLPVLPALAVLAADALAALVEAIPERRRIIPFVLAAIAVLPGVRDSVVWGRTLYRPDTRDEARRWIEEHLPGKSRIAVDSHMHNQLPELRSLDHYLEYARGNQDAPEEVRRKIEAFGREAALYEIVPVRADVEPPEIPERYRAQVERHPPLARHFARRWRTPAELAESGVEAIVTTSAYRDRFTGTLPDEDSVLHPFTLAGAEFYGALERSTDYHLEVAFEPGEDGTGPTIRVYRRRPR